MFLLLRVWGDMGNFLVLFCRWLEHTHMGVGIVESSWAYPFVQLIHFTGLSLWVGTSLCLDFRLLGIGSKRQTPFQLSSALLAWKWIGFFIAVCGGFMLFSTAATGYIVNPAFRTKLGLLLPLGLLLDIVIQYKMPHWGQTREAPPLAKVAGLLEAFVWTAVVTAAALIPTFASEPF